MASYIGSPGPFDHRTQKWSSYQTQFEHFLRVNEITEDKKTSCIIALIGAETYEILESLVFPEKPEIFKSDDLFKRLTAHFEPKRLKIAEQYRFWRNTQGPSQSLADYISSLRKMASTCEFPGEYLPDALCTAFVLGLRDENIARKLLSEKDLTLDKAISIAQNMEAAGKEANEITAQTPNSVSIIKTPSKRSTPKTLPPGPCPSCGAKDHWRSACLHRNTVCSCCKRMGHLARVCRDRHKQHSGKTKHFYLPKNRTNVINAAEESERCTVVLTVNSSSPSKPVFVSVKLNEKTVKLQLDTGASITLISEATWKRIGSPQLDPPAVRLQNYSEDDIPLLGDCQVSVQCDGKTCNLPITVTKGNRLDLLGRSWIEALKLDLNHLYHVNHVNISNNSQALVGIMRRYAKVFQEGLGHCTKHKVHLTLKSDAQPRFFKPRPLPFALKPAVEMDIQRLVHNGVLQKVEHSDWATPIVVVPKPSKAVRICGDFSVTVNPQLNINQYPLPRPEELFTALNGGCKFTKLDFSDAYLQLELDDESRNFMVISTHLGLYQYTRLPFGIAAAPAIFQQTMETMLQGLSGVVCYLDDIVVTGKSDVEHLQNLERVLAKIQEYGFQVRKEKCSFMQDSVEYLGHIVDKNGIHVSPKKVKGIVEMPKPRNQHQLRSFLGMVNHYGKFLCNLSDMCAPLNKLLQKEQPWSWTNSCQDVFDRIKKELVSTEALAHYDPSLPLFLAADASSIGVGAVIFHRYPDKTERAIAHASKTLTPAERNYSQIEREALSIIYGIKKFHQYLWGRHFTIQTDHKPLTTIFGGKKGIPTTTASRLQRWSIILMGYSFEIEYKSTKQFGNADGLSRLPAGPDKAFDSLDPGRICVVQNIHEEQIQDLPLKAGDIARETAKDPILRSVKYHTLNGWPNQIQNETLQPYFRRRHELTVLNGCLLWGMRVVIPKSHQTSLLQALHETHLGKVKMKMLARSHFWWPKLDGEIEETSNNCKECSELSRDPAKVPLHQWQYPQRPWQRLHIDYAGPFLEMMWFIIIDAHSKWPIVIPTKKASTEATVEMMLDVFTTHGLCEQIISDNGPQFISREFEDFCKSRGIDHVLSPPYHPQSNGEAERFVQTFKSAMQKAKQGGKAVKPALRNFLLTYRITPHCTTGIPPCELLMKRHLKTKLDLIHPLQSPNQTVQQAKANQKKHYDMHTSKRKFSVGNQVLVRNYRSQPKWIPGKITRQIGGITYLVQVKHGVWKRHANQLKINKSNDWDYEHKDSDLPSTSENVPTSKQETPAQDGSRRYPIRERHPPDRYGF